MNKYYSFSKRFFLIFGLIGLLMVESIHAQTPAFYKGLGTSTNTIPMNVTAATTQQMYVPGDFNTLPTTGYITKIYFRNSAANATGTYTNFSVSFLQNDMTTFPNTTFLTGFTNALFAASITINGNATAGGWYEIPLTTPFTYDNGKTLIVEIKYDSRTGGITGYTTTASVNRRLTSSTLGATTGTLGTLFGDFGMDLSPLPSCTVPPTAGTAITTVQTSVCSGADVFLNLSGNSIGSGQTYEWQSSLTEVGGYADISTSSISPIHTTNPTETRYYRAAVNCSGNTQYSTPVQVVVSPPLPANTYTINSYQPTGGGNYQTITDAINALNCGIAGPITFNVTPGTGPYTEQITIPPVSGTSASSPIVFNGNGNTIQFAPISAARHIVKFNGADFVTINNFTIIGTDLTYGWGIFLTNASDNNTISNCTIDLTAITTSATTEANSVGIVASASATTVMSAGNNANNLTLSGNTIKAGYRGIGLNGSATGINAINNVVTGNTIQDFYTEGITLSNVSNATVSRNDISRANRTTVTTFAGIQLEADCHSNLISANKIHDTHNTATTQTGAAYGIYLTSVDAIAGSENKIVNNLIYNFNSSGGTQYGLYNSSSDGAWYFHNTVVLDNNASTAGITRGFYQLTAAANIQVKNNLIYITRTGTGAKHALYFGNTSSSIISNKNVLFVNSPAGTNGIGFFSTNHVTLANWQAANSGAYDQQSKSADPLFVNPGGGDYTPNIPEINNIGDNVGVSTDINGNSRNLNNPDPGAYEFSGGPCSNPPTPGPLKSSTVVACSGAEFTLDLVTEPIGDGLTYQWQKSSDNASFTNIGTSQVTGTKTVSQTANTYYRVIVTCSGGTPVNSPSIYITTPGAVSGTYTINSAVPTGGNNFQTFNAAIDHIKCTIDGPVVFNVAAGTTYNEQVIIPAVGGTSPTNTITINGNGATINFISVNSAERAVIKLAGTDYVTINNLLINTLGTTTGEYGYGIQLIENADNNTITNCTITSNTSLSSTNYAGIVINSSLAASPTGTGNSQCDNNTITGNIITGGYAGVTIVANGITNIVTDNKVINNIISDFYIYGIYLNGSINTLVERNDISRPVRSTLSSFYGVYLTTGTVLTKVSKNRIHDSFNGNMASTSASYGVYASADATVGNENIISNNFIYKFNNSGTQYALYNSSSAYAKYYHNSILLDGPATTSATYDTRGVYQTGAAVGLEFKNNIISITRAGIGENHCMYFATATTVFVSDNNDLFINTTTGTLNNVAFYNSIQYATLADWKGGTSKDLNSLSTDPLFSSDSDLHLQMTSTLDDKGAFISGIATDIDEDARDGSTPDIGADELPLNPLLDIKASSLVEPVITSGCYTSAERVVIRIRNNSASPINFATNNVQVTVNVTGPTSNSLNVTLNSGVLAAGATQDVIVNGTLNMSMDGTYTFTATAVVAGDANTTNDAMPSTTRTKIALSGGTPSADPGAYCLNGGAPTLSTTGATAYAGLQWQQSSTSGGGFTNIPGGTTSPYTLPAPINETMYYRLLTFCSTTTITSSEITVIVYKPAITSTTPGSRCGAGAVTLSATGSAGTMLNWYTTLTGGVPTYTGSSFTTPGISSTTTYYVSAAVSGISGSVGPLNPASVGAGGGTAAAITTYFMSFDVLLPTVLNSVDIFPVAAVGSNGSIVIQNSTGATIATVPYVTTVTGGITAQTIPMNVMLPAGAGYKMGQSPAISLFRNTAGAVYPYTSAAININSNNFNPDYYYYFYNWQFGTQCETARIPVTATINSPADNTWIGATSTDWNNPANWSCPVVPDMNTNVTIPAGAIVIISSEANVRSLNINPAASFTVAAGVNLIIHH